MSTEQPRKKFFHQRFPRLDRLLHFGETRWMRRMRHLELEDPEAQQRLLERHEMQRQKLRESAQGRDRHGNGG